MAEVVGGLLAYGALELCSSLFMAMIKSKVVPRIKTMASGMTASKKAPLGLTKSGDSSCGGEADGSQEEHWEDWGREVIVKASENRNVQASLDTAPLLRAIGGNQQEVRVIVVRVVRHIRHICLWIKRKMPYSKPAE